MFEHFYYKKESQPVSHSSPTLQLNKHFPFNLSHVWFIQNTLHLKLQFSPYDLKHSESIVLLFMLLYKTVNGYIFRSQSNFVEYKS